MVKAQLSFRPDFPYVVKIENDPNSYAHYVAVFPTFKEMITWIDKGAHMSEAFMCGGHNVVSVPGTYYCDYVYTVVGDRKVYCREYNTPRRHPKYNMVYSCWAVIESA